MVRRTALATGLVFTATAAIAAASHSMGLMIAAVGLAVLAFVAYLALGDWGID